MNYIWSLICATDYVSNFQLKTKVSAVVAAALLSIITIQAAAFASVELIPAQAKQGQTVEVRVLPGDSASPDDPAAASGTVSGEPSPAVLFRKKKYKLFPVSGAPEQPVPGPNSGSRALIGVPANLPPGTYSIKIGDLEKKLTVAAGGFGIQTLRLPPGKDNFVASPGEEAAVAAAKATVSSKQLWNGKFIRPVQSRVSSTFGLRRRVNGKLLSDYFHSGMDFAAATGTPVKAVQSGKVILVGRSWKLHGNTICIDHGQGVLSFYIHLSKIFVKDGDMVETGQKIGAVGSTGRANGPHLHFSIYVNNDATNPGDWFTKIF